MTGGIDMKQEMPSTFILNRNDKQYFYVEGKQSRLHGPVYHVYYNKKEKPIFYRAENFVEVHGLDEKQKISTFAMKRNKAKLISVRAAWKPHLRD